MATGLTNYLTHCGPINMHISDTYPVSILYKKLYVYNGDIPIPHQKFCWLVDNVKFTSQKNQSNKVTGLFTNKKFTEYLDTFDKTVHTMLTELFTEDFLLVPSYKTNKYAPCSINLHYGPNILSFSHTNDKLQDFNIMDHLNQTCSVVIELSDIMIGDAIYWLNYSIKQIKLHSSSDESLFSLVSNVQPVPRTSFVPFAPSIPFIPPAPVLPTSPINGSSPLVRLGPSIIGENEQAKPAITPGFAVSPGDILNQLAKLKKKQKKEELEINIEPSLVITPDDIKR